jgi:hypothetical protein
MLAIEVPGACPPFRFPAINHQFKLRESDFLLVAGGFLCQAAIRILIRRNPNII